MKTQTRTDAHSALLTTLSSDTAEMHIPRQSRAKEELVKRMGINGTRTEQVRRSKRGTLYMKIQAAGWDWHFLFVRHESTLCFRHVDLVVCHCHLEIYSFLTWWLGFHTDSTSVTEAPHTMLLNRHCVVWWHWQPVVGNNAIYRVLKIPLLPSRC